MSGKSLRSLIQPGISKRGDFPIRMTSMALLVIDIQEELSEIDVNSSEYKHATSLPRMITNSEKLIRAVRASRNNGKGGEVIFTYLESHTNNSRDVSFDYKLSGSLSSLPNPNNPAKFIHGITPIAGEDIRIPKTSCSVFQSTNLDYILRNLHVEQLVVVGQLTDQCIESAVRDAADLGYLVTVVEDACAANSEEDHQKGLYGMKGFARKISTRQALDEIGSVECYDGNAGWLLTVDESIKREMSSSITNVHSFAIPPASNFTINRTDGYQAAILRSLRSAGVKFLRYTVVDAYNTIRCKTVPLSHAISSLTKRNQTSSRTSTLPMESVACIAEVCFAGLPTHSDAIVSSSNLSARNVLTLEPDFSSLRVLPYAPKTAMIMCTAHNQRTRELSPFCTRGLLKRVLDEARRDMGVEFCVGAELEFQLYRAGRDGSFQPVDMSTFANSTSLNDQEDFISALHDQLEQQDIPIEQIHAESAPGQLEVVLNHSNDVVQLADDILFARETVTACAKQYGMKALFLPKTSATQAGNGLHLHFSFHDVSCEQTNSFSDPARPTGISSRGESFVEGILDHLPSLLSFSLPTVNSFRRMGPGCWTGHEVVWSIEDKEVPIRVCLDLKARDVTNVEYKLSDATANVYLELAMILSAGLHGMKHRKKLRPMHGDIVASCKDAVPVNPMPTSLQSSIDFLKADDFLLSILGSELSNAYIAVREAEEAINCKKSLEDEVIDAFKRA